VIVNRPYESPADVAGDVDVDVDLTKFAAGN